MAFQTYRPKEVARAIVRSAVGVSPLVGAGLRAAKKAAPYLRTGVPIRMKHKSHVSSHFAGPVDGPAPWPMAPPKNAPVAQVNSKPYLGAGEAMKVKHVTDMNKETTPGSTDSN